MGLAACRLILYADTSRHNWCWYICIAGSHDFKITKQSQDSTGPLINSAGDCSASNAGQHACCSMQGPVQMGSLLATLLRISPQMWSMLNDSKIKRVHMPGLEHK